MAATILQTLYARSNRTVISNIQTGNAYGSHDQSLVESHDGSDSSYDMRGIQGDGVNPGNAKLGIYYYLDLCTVASEITKLVARFRGKYDGNPDVADLLFWSNATEIMAIGLGTTIDWITLDLLVVPGTSNKWTADDINGRTWGWLGSLATIGVDTGSYVRVYGYEFELQVWGEAQVNRNKISRLINGRR